AGLWLAGRVWPWSFGGYGAPAELGGAGPVEVLTPPSTVAAIAAGYRPLVHPSALTAPVLAGRGPRGGGAPPWGRARGGSAGWRRRSAGGRSAGRLPRSARG